MTASYQKAELCFQYPDSWELNEVLRPPGLWEVTVYSPLGAFWSVRYERPAIDPRQVAEEAVTAMREEYADLEATPVTEVVEEAELIGMDMSFFCLDMTNTAQVRATSTSDGTYTILCQAEDGDFQQLEPVFQAMITSLLRSKS